MAAQLFDTFLHVFQLSDPDAPELAARLVSGAGVQGAQVGPWLALFAMGEQELLAGEAYVELDEPSSVLIANLAPDTDYQWLLDGTRLSWSNASIEGATVRSSSQGTLRFEAPGL